MNRSIDLILTAANRAQARGYLHELRQRRRDGLLEGVERALVVPDPAGRRAGSGTATLLALRALVERIRRERRPASIDPAAALAGPRVLIIHSGGDSRRLVAYAAHGKIFTPLPCDDRPPQASTLFDLILQDLRSITWPESGGVLVASGDVLLGVAKHHLRVDSDGVQCVASPGDLQRASRHGVFVADDRGHVLDVLQKPDEQTLRSHLPGALDASSRALIDLGLVFLPPRIAARWMDAAEDSGVFRTPASTLDLYGEMLPAIARGRLREAVSDDTRGTQFLAAISGSGSENDRLRVHRLPDSLFMHVGSSREFLDTVVPPRQTPSDALNRGRLRMTLNSLFDADSNVADRVVVESCWLSQMFALPGCNVLVGVPRECDSMITLARNAGLACFPIGEGDWTAIAFGLDDDFKTHADSGGTFGNQPLARVPPCRWRDGDPDRSLWHARLWHVGPATDAVDHAIAMLIDPALAAKCEDLVCAAEIMPRVNDRRLLKHRLQVMREAAFVAVAKRVRRSITLVRSPRSAAIDVGRIVRVSAPVRIDLAGGWSDTPPICHDVGGTVVNIALRLDGAQPIRAEARLIEQTLIRIRSVDLNKSIELHRAEEVLDHRDPSDWAALPKASLVQAGIAPSTAGDGDHAALGQWLRALGGGVELTISSDLPKGSGLGTSSILGTATLACLARLMGETPSRETLIARTSALEQMMSTAGGWQDQAGGITPGCKLLTTAPGPEQVPIEESLPMPTDFWRERVLLYSTGLQRLARDILHNVVWRWISREREARRIVERLREGAMSMRDGLRAGDMDGFARGVLDYWELKKAIDPGATTPVIESLIERVKPLLSAWELPGAGGGGFLFMIARSRRDASRVREMLIAHPPNAQARFYEPAIDDSGLSITLDLI